MSSRITFVVLILTACEGVHEVRAVYPGGGTDSGAVDIVMTSPSDKLTVAIGDKIVVDRQAARRAHVDGVPSGPAHVRVVTAGGCERHTQSDYDVTVPPNGVATLALAGPEEDHGCGIFMGLLYIGMGVEAIAVVAVTEAARQAHSMSHIK